MPGCPRYEQSKPPIGSSGGAQVHRSGMHCCLPETALRSTHILQCFLFSLWPSSLQSSTLSLCQSGFLLLPMSPSLSLNRKEINNLVLLVFTQISIEFIYHICLELPKKQSSCSLMPSWVVLLNVVCVTRRISVSI